MQSFGMEMCNDASITKEDRNMDSTAQHQQHGNAVQASTGVKFSH